MDKTLAKLDHKLDAILSILLVNGGMTVEEIREHIEKIDKLYR